MISIKRSQCPDSLNKLEDEFRRNDYKNGDVKSKLLEMQHGKCCYCEREIYNLPETEREIEHYFPQVYFKNENGEINWSRANSWDNLLYACGKCNNTKSGTPPIDKNTNEIKILNPSLPELNPQDHISFLVDDPFIFYIPNNLSHIGNNTITNLKFATRVDLLQELKISKAEIDLLFIKIENSIITNDSIRLLEYLNELCRKTSAHKKLASFSRFYINMCWEQLKQNKINILRQRFTITITIPEIQICNGHEIVA